MLLWSLCFLFLLIGLHLFWREGIGIVSPFRIRNELKALAKVIGVLHELQETLESGLVPTPERWSLLQKLQAPWGELAFSCLEELRSHGGSLLPTLKRLRNLAEEHDRALKEARSKSSQALAQVLACLGLVPLFGVTLFLILPGIENHFQKWTLLCLLASGLTAFGALWIFALAEQARWGGLKKEEQPWILAVFCAGEKFLALVRAGTPADLSWTRSCELLLVHAKTLAHHWGHSVWEDREKQTSLISRRESSVRETILNSTHSLRKAIQISLMEGRPCIERVEAVFHALRHDIRMGIDRELTCLGINALKPLFLCVAPAMLGLLAFGLYLAWIEMNGGTGGLF